MLVALIVLYVTSAGQKGYLPIIVIVWIKIGVIAEILMKGTTTTHKMAL